MHFCIVVVISLLLPSALLAEGGVEPPPPPTEESGLPENCVFPGIVINSSSKMIRIAWDTDDAPFQWNYADLSPGQNSTIHTCDTDYYTYRHATWYHGTMTMLAWHFSPYIFHMTWECEDHQRDNTVQCWFRGFNFNPYG